VTTEGGNAAMIVPNAWGSFGGWIITSSPSKIFKDFWREKFSCKKTCPLQKGFQIDWDIGRSPAPKNSKIQEYSTEESVISSVTIYSNPSRGS
jgi:hypothetical protein